MRISYILPRPSGLRFPAVVLASNALCYHLRLLDIVADFGRENLAYFRQGHTSLESKVPGNLGGVADLTRGEGTLGLGVETGRNAPWRPCAALLQDHHNVRPMFFAAATWWAVVVHALLAFVNGGG
jgi:hypothetical protein